MKVEVLNGEVGVGDLVAWNSNLYGKCTGKVVKITVTDRYVYDIINRTSAAKPMAQLTVRTKTREKLVWDVRSQSYVPYKPIYSHPTTLYCLNRVAKINKE